MNTRKNEQGQVRDSILLKKGVLFQATSSHNLSRQYFILLIAILACLPLSGQSVVKGIVLDGDETPVEYATVSLSTLNFRRLLAFSSTDENGLFKLSTDTLPAWLIVSYLGRKPDTSRVSVSGNLDPITLTDKGTDLPDIIVSGVQAPVTLRGDTTTYDLSDFRDSMDNRLEDVLRRLPGIEVDESGSIKVHGKPLHRITIEGSDLFGRNYQTASKNFRAKDIGTIEAIDHFEDNPVLKSVNNSEAVVLNIKLEENVKSVLGGNLILGAGYGDKVKHHNNATIFKVTPAHKSMLIANADNIASGFNLGGMKQNQGYTGKRDFSAPSLTPFYLVQPPSIDNLGLPSYYTDDGNESSLNFNHESDLSDTWKMNFRYNLIRSKKSQIVSNRTEILDNVAEYELVNTYDWQTSSGESTPQLKFSYLSESKKSSVDFLATFGNATADWTSNFNNPEYDVQSVGDAKDQMKLYRVLYSQEYGAGSVGQLELSSESYSENINTTFASEELVNLLTDDDIAEVSQRINLTKRLTSLNYTFLRQASRLSFSAGSSLGKRRVFGSQLKPNDEARWLFEGVETGFTYRYWRQNFKVGYSLGKKTEVKGLIDFGRKYPGSRFNLPIHSAGNIELERVRNDGGRLRLSVFHNRFSLNDDRALYGLHYLSSPFDLYQTGANFSPTTSRGLMFYMETQNIIRLRNTQLSSSYTETLNDDFLAASFLGNITKYKLVYGQSTRRASINIRHSRFSQFTKSDVKFRITGGILSTDYLLNGENFAVKILNSEFEFKGSARLTNIIRLKFTTVAKTQFLLSGNTNFTRWQNRLSSFAKFKGGQIYGDVVHISTLQNGDASNNLVVEVGLDKRISIGNKGIYFRLKVYNLLDKDLLGLRSTYDFYTFSREVNSTGRFFLLTADYSL